MDLVHESERPGREKPTLADAVYHRIKDEIFQFRMAPGRQILDALVHRRAERADMLIKAHIAASRAEIRHITLHRLALAAGDAAQVAQG